jgi:dolichyl-phosphate beta-glucosyltransferase
VIHQVEYLSVVIPAFNEARRIGGTLDELRHWLLDSRLEWEVRVVDDGSEDETVTVVERIAQREPRIVVQREPHRGKGGTVRAGVLAARGGLRFMCDADLSMPVRELARFLDVVPSRCDIAVGSREGASATRVGEPTHRHLMGRAYNALVRGALLPGISDSQCGFKLFTARAAEAIFSKTRIHGWAFDVEALFIARQQGWRIAEVPIEWHYQADSRVSVARDPFRMVRDLWRIRANARRGLYESEVSGTPEGVASVRDEWRAPL